MLLARVCVSDSVQADLDRVACLFGWTTRGESIVSLNCIPSCGENIAAIGPLQPLPQVGPWGNICKVVQEAGVYPTECTSPRGDIFPSTRLPLCTTEWC